MANNKRKTVDAKLDSYEYIQKKAKSVDNEFYRLNSLLGNTWALFYVLLGGREAGKSYAVMEHCLKEYKREGKQFVWLRLTDNERDHLLKNNAQNLIEGDLLRKYGLDIHAKCGVVYEVLERDSKDKIVKEKPMCRVMSLSTFYNDKGNALYDPKEIEEFGKNIVLDEMNREGAARKTFDITDAFVNQMENLVRSSKENFKVFMIGNTLEEAGDLLCCFNFIPEKFGRYKLRKQRCIMEYMPPSRKYLTRREGSVADLLTPNKSTFTNRVETDKTLIYKGRLRRPLYIIAFKDGAEVAQFTVWNGNIVCQYNGEKVRKIPMSPYLDMVYNTEAVGNIIEMFDNRVFGFRDLITQKTFKKYLSLTKPRK